jgi:hypothetical protein
LGGFPCEGGLGAVEGAAGVGDRPPEGGDGGLALLQDGGGHRMTFRGEKWTKVHTMRFGVVKGNADDARWHFVR